MKLVSVVIPVYNREKTVKKAVESVLKQTYQELEIIVVDDCSTDRTVEIIKSINDDRIKLVCSKKNNGACAARNTGIDYSEGEIIAFQDSDDIWHKDKLEKSLFYLEKEQADLVFSALVRSEKKRNTTEKSLMPAYNLNNETDQVEKVLSQNCVSTQTIVAKKEVFDKVRFDKTFPRFQDWDFIIQALLRDIKVYYIEEPLVDCFVLKDSITGDGKKAIKALRLLEKKYLSEYEKRQNAYEKYCAKAGYLTEMSGGNGLYFFYKEEKIRRTIPKQMKILITKLRLYRPLNQLLGTKIEAIYRWKQKGKR